MEFLGQVPLFKRLPLSHYPILARELRGICWEQGQIVVEHGAQLTEFALVAEGSAEVQVISADGSIASAQTLRPGDYFGEKALQTGGGVVIRSPAHIVAGPGLVTLAMAPAEFEEFGLRKHLTFPKRRALSRCVLRKGMSSEACSKGEEQRKFISDAVRANQNLRSLVDLQEGIVQQMCNAATRQEVRAGKKVVQRGEYGGMFYIVESGSFELRLDEGTTSAQTGDVLSRVRSGLVGGLLSAAVCKHHAADAIASETQQRKHRKELFLQKLAHTKDFANSSPPNSLSRTFSMTTLRCTEGSASQCEPDISLPGSAVTRCVSFHAGAGESGSAIPIENSSSSLISSAAPSPLVKGASGLGSGRGKGDRSAAEYPSLLGAETPGTRGRFDATLASESGQDGSVLGIRGRAECFGELALLYHAPRTSTAVAREDSVVWAVSQAQFRRIMRSTQQDRVARIVNLLGQVDLLQGLLSEEKLELAQKILTAKFKQGDWLIHEGEEQEVWYIITKGECTMSKPAVAGAVEGKELAKLQWPQHFGERALLRGRPSEFSVRASSEQEVECLVLDGSTFRELAGHLSAEDFRRAAEDDLLQFAKYKAARAVPKLKGLLSLLERETDTATPGSARRRPGSTPAAGGGGGDEAEAVLKLDPVMGTRALDRIGILGRGAFGLVTLERDPATKQRFALKTVSKKHIVRNELQKAVKYERQILTMIDSPFIIRLHATFRDANYLYFLFEPLLGGELHSRMCREPSRFRDPKVYRFVLGCVTCALEHLHDRNVVYRDLKPENVLLDGHGYVKLCDLGFAKFVLGKTMTLCGTPEYMAPEVIMHSGYDRMVDWWAIGILAYECVCGCTPFVDEDSASPEVIFANILSTREEIVEMPPRTLPCTDDFVASLLQFSPGKRLGIGGAAQIKGHRIFAPLDFQALCRQQLRAPYVPRVKSEAELARTLHKKNALACPCDDDKEDRDDGPASMDGSIENSRSTAATEEDEFWDCDF